MPNSNILMYTTEDGLTKIETTFENDTVWLSIDQMAELFQRDRSVIGKHVRNIFKEGELNKESVWAKFAYTAVDGNSTILGVVGSGIDVKEKFGKSGFYEVGKRYLWRRPSWR